MSGPVRLTHRDSRHLVDVGTGAFVHIPTTAYDVALAQVAPTTLAVGDWDGDAIKDFCARVRKQLKEG